MAGGGATARVLGLTGPIACGKSTVEEMLRQLGAVEVIDADHVVHGLMGPSDPVTERIRESFGARVMAPDGSVDRSALGRLVFRNREALERLEAIVHPAVRQAIRTRLEELRDRPGVVVVDAVKLLQSDLLPLCDAVWVIRCEPNEQRRRLVELRGMEEDDAAARVAAQPSFNHSAVTAVIDNSSSPEALRRQVEDAWKALLDRWQLTSDRV